MPNILLVGATSSIASCYARMEARDGSRFALVGRDAARLKATEADLVARGSAGVAAWTLDFSKVEDYAGVVSHAREFLGTIDIVLIAHGMLPDPASCERDSLLAAQAFHANATSSIVMMLECVRVLRCQGGGTLAIISSVAGDRGRASNYLYGSAKAAVTAAASGLRQSLLKENVHVLTVKPGLIDTPMTQNFDKGVLWSQPERVATGIRRAIANKRAIVYLPAFWWVIMRIITHIPEWLFRRIRL